MMRHALDLPSRVRKHHGRLVCAHELDDLVEQVFPLRERRDRRQLSIGREHLQIERAQVPDVDDVAGPSAREKILDPRGIAAHHGPGKCVTPGTTGRRWHLPSAVSASLRLSGMQDSSGTLRGVCARSSLRRLANG